MDGDSTGLTEKEREEAERFDKDIVEYYGHDARIVDCGDEPEFGMPTWGGVNGDIIPFTIEYAPRHLPEKYWDVSCY
jgi:hypothetical protein